MEKKYNLDDETLWERIRDKTPYGYLIERYWDDARMFVKRWYQKLFWGFSNEECWNLAYSNAKWILPRLKHFRNNLHSNPPNLEKGHNDVGHRVFLGDETDNQPEGERFYLTIEEWGDRLDKMIYAFEFILTEDDIIGNCYPADYNWGFTTKPCEDRPNCKEMVWNDGRKPDYTYYQECLKRHEEGMRLFVLYYRHLWD